MSDPREELGEFFDMFYGDQNGYAYAPTKDLTRKPSDKRFWSQYFFEWPRERNKLIDHCLFFTDQRDVYFSPALFSNNEGAEKPDVLGTQYVWVDFDGNAPVELEGAPEPTIKVQSSDDLNQHWYWKLDKFETNPQELANLERISQFLTVKGQGDLGSWNINRVLRPINTIHQESKKRVKIITTRQGVYSPESFGIIPQVTTDIKESELGSIPPVIRVLSKYQWSEEAFNLFTTEAPPTKEGYADGKGHRSEMMARMGHFCIEMGMNNEEAMAILLFVDNKWGKYKNRQDRKKVLVNLINYCRSKHTVDPIELEANDPYRVFTWDEWQASDIRVEWIIPGLVHKKGIVIVAGPPGVGKSQLSIRFMEAMAKGDTFLKWKAERPIKILFVSMEMPHEELRQFTDTMDFDVNEDLRANFLVLPIGSGIKLSKVENQGRIVDIIEKYRPDGVIFDSLAKSIQDNLSDDKQILDMYQFIKGTIQRHYGCFVWFIHHTRKLMPGAKHKPNKLDDLFGSQYIGGDATTVLQLSNNGTNIELACTKLRMAEQWRTFHIKRTPKLNFEAIEGFSKKPTNLPIFGFEDDKKSDSDDDGNPPVDLADSL